MQALAFKNVSYKYPTAVIPTLRGVDFALDAGSTTLLLGPTGSGKSTILHLARGVHLRHGGEFRGEISIWGQCTSGLRPEEVVRLGLGWVGQDPSLNLHQLGVREEVMSGPIYLNLPWQVANRLANSSLDALEISTLSHLDPTQLSGGQMQRVAIAAALTVIFYAAEEEGHQGLLILDEPDSFLDPAGRQDLLNALAQLKERGVTILIATHCPDRYFALASQALLIDDGAVILHGSVSSVLEDEQTRRTVGWPLQFRVGRVLRDSGLLDHSLGSPFDAAAWPTLGNLAAGPFDNGHPSVPPSPIIRYDHVSFSYDSHQPSLQSLVGSLPKGSLISIVGGNGAGKTTLAKVSVGVLQPGSGTISLLGRRLDSYGKEELARLATYIAQLPKDMFFTNHVQAECLLGVTIHGLADADSRVENALRRARLDNCSSLPVEALSGGQMRKLSLACSAFLFEPELLFLDEPEFGVDPQQWIAIYDEILQMLDRGTTVVLVTHDLEQALFSDHVVLMGDGLIVAHGHPNDIFRDEQRLRKFGLEQPALYSLFKRAWRLQRPIRTERQLISVLTRTQQTK